MEEIPDNFFITEEYKLFTETIQGYSQQFYALPSASTDYDLTGQVLWPGASHLSSYLLSHPSLIENKTVLEVGAGSGLCGLFCSQVASRTILTDGNEIVMRLLMKNKNFGKNIEVALVEWGAEDPTEELRKVGLPVEYEVIVGADVIYWSNSIQPLFKTIDRLLGKSGVFIMCYTVRAMNTYRELMSLSEIAGFKADLVWQEENTHIYEFRRT